MKTFRCVDWQREGGIVRWVVWAMASFFKSKTSLVAENLCLRQQLLVLRRKNQRPRLQDSDRRFWILVTRWWPDWQKWIKKHAGKKIEARTPGTKLKAIEDAPGSYVKVRIDAE